MPPSLDSSSRPWASKAKARESAWIVELLAVPESVICWNVVVPPCRTRR
jgi:hypothetical protein